MSEKPKRKAKRPFLASLPEWAASLIPGQAFETVMEAPMVTVLDAVKTLPDRYTHREITLTLKITEFDRDQASVSVEVERPGHENRQLTAVGQLLLADENGRTFIYGYARQAVGYVVVPTVAIVAIVILGVLASPMSPGVGLLVLLALGGFMALRVTQMQDDTTLLIDAITGLQVTDA